MTPYSQRDTRWSSKILGNNSHRTIGQDGCVITSLAMMVDKTPDVVDSILVQNGGFVGELVVWSRACQALGLTFSGSGTGSPSLYPAIAWTDYFKAHGYPTHYFVVLDAHTIIDPLDAKTKSNPYPIKGYYYIHPTNSLTMDQLTELNQLRALVANLKSGKTNEYKLPDGKIYQLLAYAHWEDYVAMGCDTQFLIDVDQAFPEEVRSLRKGGYQPQ